MEIISIPGYTTTEKMEIGEKFLLPKVIKESGLPKDSLLIDTNIIGSIINGHTREAGVRNLERKLGSICRYVAVDYTTKKQELEQQTPPTENPKDTKSTDEKKELIDFKYPVVNITDSKLNEILGFPKFKPKEVKDLNPGMCIGLAWTSVGGTIMNVETSISKGNGQVKLTGNLGDVMKESTVTALSWIKSNSTKLGIN